MTKTIPNENLPFVTVVMPVRNEAEFIESSLSSVLIQDYPPDLLEVLVSDGMSNDNTREIIAEMLSNKNIPVKVLENPGRIVSTSMNIAIRQAKGDVVVRVDGHTVIEKDYVRQCVGALKRTGAANVGGPMRAIGDGYIAESITLATRTPFGIGNSSFHYSNKEQFVDTVYMGAFQKKTLFRAGLFDERFIRHQDYELNYRIREQGGSIFLTPKIRSIYYVRNSLRKLCKQYFQYGFWKGKLLRWKPKSIKWRHTLPPLLVFSLVSGMLLTVLIPEVLPGIMLLIALYLIFILLGSLYTIKLKRIKYILVLPIIFTCLHLSWGFGVWLGLLSKKL